jgi:hypothetical protein
MSTINIHHQGITLEWVIKDPAAADRAVATLWALITDSGAVPAAVVPAQKNKSTRRRAITTALLTEVAQTYRAAPDSGKMRAIRDTFDVSQPTATSWVYRARQEGLLEPSATHGLDGRKPRIADAILTDGVEATAR